MGLFHKLDSVIGVGGS